MIYFANRQKELMSNYVLETLLNYWLKYTVAVSVFSEIKSIDLIKIYSLVCEIN